MPRSMARNLLLLMNGGGGGVTFLVRDDFTTDESAPKASPHSANPGPGTLTMVQTDGQLSSSSGQLNFPAQTTPAWGDQGFYEAGGRSRLAGRTLLSKFQASNFGAGGLLTTWLTAAALNTTGAGGQAGGLTALTSSLFAQDLSVSLPFASTVDTDYRYALVLRSSGCFYFVKGGAFTNWTLLFVSGIGSQATLYPGVSNYNAVAAMDTFRIFDLPAPFATDKGIATLDVSAVADTDYAAVADGVLLLTITAPGTLANSAGLRFRKNGNDYWQVNFNSGGDLILQRYAAGVAQGSPATLASSVITTSGTRTICVVTYGGNFDVYTLSGSTWTKRAGVQSDGVLNANSGLLPFAGAGWTLGALEAYARTSSQYNVLDTFLA